MISRLAAFRVAATIAMAAFLGLAAVPAQAQDSKGSLAFSAGAYDTGLFGGDNDAAGMFTGEYRYDYKLFGLAQPIIGGFVTTDGTVYGYFGFQSDINIGKLFGSESDFWNRIHFTPSGAVGLWAQGNSEKDLGHIIEFKNGAELTYQFDSGVRVGASLYHLSNASIGDDNPGTEVASFVVVVPWSKLFGK